MSTDEHHDRIEDHLRVDPGYHEHHQPGHHIEHVHSHGHDNVADEVTKSTQERISGGKCSIGAIFDLPEIKTTPSFNEQRRLLMQEHEAKHSDSK